MVPKTGQRAGRDRRSKMMASFLRNVRLIVGALVLAFTVLLTANAGASRSIRPPNQ